MSGGSFGGEYCDWESLMTVRVRKAHQCDVCCLWIPAGHYAAVRCYGGVGTAHTDYFHLACRSLWERVSDDGRNEIFHQNTLETVEDELDRTLADTHRSIVRWSHGGPWVPVDACDE